MMDVTNVTFKAIALCGLKKKYNNKNDQSILTQNHSTQDSITLFSSFPPITQFHKSYLTKQITLRKKKLLTGTNGISARIHTLTDYT